MTGRVKLGRPPEKRISEKEKEEIKKYLSSAIEDIKNREYKSGIEKLVKIEHIIEEKDEYEIPTWYMPHQIGGGKEDAWPEEFGAYESGDEILLQILFRL